MAPPARLERTTFRLGGGPSILVRYGGKFQYCYLTKTISFCQSFSKYFRECAYNDLQCFYRRDHMHKNLLPKEPEAPEDLDEWIFEEQEYKVSER